MELSPTQLAKLRRRAEQLWGGQPVVWNKSQVNAAFQACEDAVENEWPSTSKISIRARFNAAIESVQAALFTADAKVILVATYLEAKARYEVEAL